MLKTFFSLQTAIMVFEKPTTIRRPLSYATNMRDGSTRRDIASAPSPMKPYNPLFIWSLEKHPSFSLHCYTNPQHIDIAGRLDGAPGQGEDIGLEQAVHPRDPDRRE